ncbi:ABC transporter substrate-binding protein [Paraburkholderia phenazinium]|uniref:Iron complex transport system substrate-binding protein n=1 Tax=Paraburkholderia phenazinium TaxID=60549 RepID=A0A1G8GXY0_9BURK|nr:ABC transporter substrate-binding protein [Paraburkholderia phenazinium]SDH99248.1 iron complex transport system substrate-binding protein [Paraburkholderia phenazinium]
MLKHSLARRVSGALAAGLLAAAIMSNASATTYPVTIRSCNRDVTFAGPPQRAISNDVNLTGMMIALGLKNRMVGYTGVSGWNTGTAELKESLGTLPELSKAYPSVETLVGANADFYFAGWNYGMKVGGEVTPATLAPLGIQVYELTESCAHVMKRPPASLDDVYRDLVNLGKIFNVESRSDALIKDMQTRIQAVSAKAAKDGKPVSVFVYDSGEDRPFTAGREAIPTALIAAAGGRNVMDDLDDSWTRVNWETVVARNPQAIVIVDYGSVTAAQKEAFLRNNPALNQIDAVKNNRFIVLPYDDATPGVANVRAIGTLAKGLHPAAFQP